MTNSFQDNTLNIDKSFTPKLKKGLDALNFTKYHTQTLFFTTPDEIKTAVNEKKYSIIFYLEKAKKVKASAVYFKLFKDRPPVPQIYIYDFTCDDISEQGLGEIHKNVWNTGCVPLLYIFTKTEIKIINCLKHPVLNNDEFIPYYLEEGIALQEMLSNTVVINRKLKKYSAELFHNGAFWEESNSMDNFSDKETANKLLLESLTVLRENLLKDSDFEEKKKIINRLLIQCILLKYLEEREDINHNPVFPSGYFKKFKNAADFCSVLVNGSFLELCDSLESKFNGKIFQWQNVSERRHLKKINFKKIADFLYAKQDIHGQNWLWQLYSFKHLPVELISHIYDHFLGENKKGKVYTPIHLANLLIDQSMPLDNADIPDLNNYKILDPSCGSGVFLVLTFKRLVQWWTIINHKKTGEWQVPDSKTIKHLMQNSIFGIDMDVEAVQLTVFSLSLALCDMLSPPEIWNQLRFNDLTEKNIVAKDFFEYINKTPEKFSLIIGNPPFIAKLETKAAMQIEDERIKNGSPNTPDKQIAFLFMEQSLTLVKESPESLVCLLMPAVFLYSAAKDYRKYIFNNNIAQIIDFTHLSDILFPGVSYPVLAVFIKNHCIVYDRILHLVIKRTRINKHKIYFEIDDYDFNYIDKQTAITDDYIWKCNFLGGGRIYRMIQYLKKERTLGEFLKKKKMENNWEFSVGYIVGNKTHIAKFITGKPMVPTKFLTINGIERKSTEKEKFFEAPRSKVIFEPPHVLLKCSINKGSIPVAFSDDYLTFRNEIIGIHAPERDKRDLINIVNKVKNNKYYIFYLMCISNRAGIRKSFNVFTKDDIMNLPFPEDEKQLLLSDAEHAVMNDVLNYMIKSQSLPGENELARKINIKDLQNFSNLFCNTLNSVYQDNEKKFRQYKIIRTPAFLCNAFRYNDKNNEKIFIEESDKLHKDIDDLIVKQAGQSLYINRIIRIYDKDKLYLIKPDQLRYWLGSIALQDADKTFTDLVEDGY